MKKVLVLLAMFGFALQANATYWYEFAHKSYVDLDSLKKSKDMAFIWVKLLNEGDVAPIENQKIWYTLNTMYVDLKNKKTALKEIYYYDLSHNKVDSYNVEQLQWDTIVPESRADFLYNVVEKYPRFEKITEEELWVDVDEQTQLDVFSLLMTNSNCCNMWVKVYKKKPKKPQAKCKYFKALLSVDLVENKFAVIESIEYNKKGKVVKINKYKDLTYTPDDDNSIKPLVDYINNLTKLLKERETNI
jgi:hypothetical protein